MGMQMSKRMDMSNEKGRRGADLNPLYQIPDEMQSAHSGMAMKPTTPVVKKPMPKQKPTSQMGSNGNVDENPIDTFHETHVSPNDLALAEVWKSVKNEEIDMDVEQYLQMLQKTAGESEDTPYNWFVVSSKYDGEAQSDACFFHCSLLVNVVSKESWSTIPLFSEQIALQSCQVIFRHTQTSNEQFFNVGTVGVVNQLFCLLAPQRGWYQVEIDLYAPYATKVKTGLYFAIQKSVQNEIIFRVQSPNVLIKADPCLFSTLSEINSISTFSGRFPPTNELSIQWTENMGGMTKTNQVSDFGSLVASAEQLVSVSLKDDVVQIQSGFFFDISSGQMSQFQIKIDANIKVISVKTNFQTPIKKWNVEKVEKENILKIWLDGGVEEKFSFLITCEKELGKLTEFQIPKFDCLKYTRNVSKQTGFIVVETSTESEILEKGRKDDLTSVDTSDVSYTVAQWLPNNPLFIYKFLQPNYSLSLITKKHDDLSVKVVEISFAHFHAFCSSTGTVHFELIFKIRNTQQQYLRLEIPQENFTVSELLLEKTDVKPAKEGKQIILIPLKKTSKKASASNETFEVRLCYFVELGVLQGERGELSIEFPFCPDLPINMLNISIITPQQEFSFGEWTGGANQVEYYLNSIAREKFLNKGFNTTSYFNFSQQLVREVITLKCNFKEKKKNIFQKRWVW